jgi:signal transduction histidine kinase
VRTVFALPTGEGVADFLRVIVHTQCAPPRRRWHHARVRRVLHPVATTSALLAAVLVGLVWLDYRATRSELVGLLRAQATALRDTVSAAARSNRRAAARSQAQLGQRLLEIARSLVALDGDRRLTARAVARVRQRDPLLRVGVFGPDGRREDLGGEHEDEPRHEPGAGPGRGGGFGPGRGLRGGGQVVRQILAGGRDEFVTDVHSPRWGGAERLAAGVTRPRGGAVVVTVDASDVARLEQPASLDTLLHEVTASSPEIAYTVLEHSGGRLAFGDPAPPAAEGSPAEGRALEVDGRPVMEFASDVVVGSEPARLRLGMRLDGVRRVERRMLGRLVASVVLAAALVGVAFSLAGLRRRYGVLSRRHALAEEALRRRDRLAAMGELASTVAHEVRNPLNAIGMTAQRLRHEFLAATPPASRERAELGDLLEVMSGETRRVNRIVQQFLDYARPPRLAPVPTELGPLVTGLAERTRPLAESRGVALGTDVSAAGRAVVDPAQLGQALDNLVRNAIEATPQGGRVDVRARCEGGGCVIEVRDTGKGIDPDHLPRIFDLYFTTRADGTGVGLAVTQQIVSAHGGTIEVDSAPGAGTTMTVRLPGTAEAARV